MSVKYFNASINTSASDYQFKTARYHQTRKRPILDEVEDYNMSINRFSVDCARIPIMILYPDGATALENDFKFTLRYSGTDYSSLCTTVPEISGTAPTVFDSDSQYFHVYSYQTIVDMFNTCFTSIIDDLNTAETLAIRVPVWYYDRVKEMIYLSVPDNFIAAGIEIYVGEKQAHRFQSFQVINDYSSSDKRTQIVLSLDRPDLGSVALFSDIFPDYRNMSSFSSLKSLIFLSNDMPIIPEFLEDDADTNGDKVINMITDFEPLINHSGDSRSVMSYYQKGEPRLTDMTGTGELRTVSFEIKWMDHKGVLHDIILNKDAICDVKFQFIRK